ncbi:hypothetical protein L6452_42172 [Arctium lappa]|uniref:Uncharacterized protein n=1 Tax=Arctium lappa TaxID=4217 RepID=A0ACB8XI81_ARCLA|nr:hypothetical protein L6452_42172 [Arctium lappa]
MEAKFVEDHTQFIINSNGLPSVYEKGESSTKVDKPVSVSTTHAKSKKKKNRHSQKRTTTGKSKNKQSFKSYCSNYQSSYVSYVKKKKPEMESEWRPKKKIDETTKSCPDIHCNRMTTHHMWYLDYGCSKHMTGQKDILSNYTEKFCGNVRFGNDQFSPILGYGDVIQENVMIKKVTYVEGLGHNLFSICQFCDKDLR